MIKNKIKSSLLMQLMALALGIILVLGMGSVVTRQYMMHTLEENILSSNEKLLLQIEAKMEDYYDTIKDIMTTVAYSPTVVEYYAQSHNERIMSRAEISQVFSNAVLLEQDIEGIYLYDMSMQQIAAMGDALDSRILGGIKDKVEFSNICYLQQANVPYYLVYFPIYDLEQKQYGRQIGMCVFLLRTNSLQGVLEGAQIREYAQVYLIDGNDRILESAGGENLTDLSADMLKSDISCVVNIQNVKMDEWKVVSRIFRSSIWQEAQDNMQMINLAYWIAILLIIVMVGFCYWRILYRVRKIGKFINENVNEPELRMEEMQPDELGIVASSLNQMLDEKERMNQEILKSQTKMYEMEIAKRQVQILAYQNQINPHFLYNTFDCIRSMALYHDVDDIAEITVALSKVFRFAVKAENIVTVEDEINYIKEYAKIIDYRFMGKIKVTIHMAEEVRKKEVIKLMLQPLVENAVFHGLEKKVEDGEVSVTVEMKDENHILFIIEDNGCGIPPAKVVWLRSTIGSNLNRKGIGIANIYQRLKLFYEDEVEFDIQSRIDEGTKITIVIPDCIKEINDKHV
ncbi:MAG: sensor histidine kinase [Lachnospiraceae bacterium]|nr:sensor histidine kinase [Lachnospiraceae bacterium]